MKYNSPITATYVISMFLTNGPLNHYLDSYFNNINLRYLDKKELFGFIKEGIVEKLPYKELIEIFESSEFNFFESILKAIHNCT